jgi:hypothetical protein
LQNSSVLRVCTASCASGLQHRHRSKHSGTDGCAVQGRHWSPLLSCAEGAPVKYSAGPSYHMKTSLLNTGITQSM